MTIVINEGTTRKKVMRHIYKLTLQMFVQKCCNPSSLILLGIEHHIIDHAINFMVVVITEKGGQFLMVSDAWNRIDRINRTTSRCKDCDSFSKLLDCIRVVCVIDVRYDIRIIPGCTSVSLVMWLCLLFNFLC